MAQSGVFLVQADQSLVAMRPTPFNAEIDFQDLLAKFPELLVGDQIDPEQPRRFMLVKQEQSIGHGLECGRWSIDHLFVDQDGIPTLVEVKRKSDTRLRREVIGQVLEYAANCQSHWSAETMRAAAEATCAASGRSYDETVAALLGPEGSEDALWTSVKTNLMAGRLRLLLVADEIPSELRTIVEFLNRQMDPAEILAVELRQFTGEGLRTVVPLLVGQVQEATLRRASTPGVRWTEDRFLTKLDEKFAPKEADVARAVLAWMKGTGLPLVWGVGRENGSVSPLLRSGGVTINPAYLSTEGKIWVQVGQMRGRPVFGDVETRRELLSRFGQVVGANFGEQDLDRLPGVTFAAIATDPEGTKKILDAFEWVIDRVRLAG